MRILLQLFLSFSQVGLFSFGGGYAALPLIQAQVVDTRGWLTLNEFSDIITISQMTPGPIALNTASFVGNRMAGIPGTIIATFSVVFFPLLISLFLAWFYYRYRNVSVMKGVLYGLRPTVVSLIASAGISILLQALFQSQSFPLELVNLSLFSLLVFIVGFILLVIKKIGPILVILLSGVASLLFSFISG
jgi:chromate transporter